MSKVISVFSVIGVRELTRVFVFPGGFVVGDFGPDLAFQLLTLTAGLVPLLAFVPARFQCLLLPRALFIAWPWDLSGMWPACSCTDFSAHPRFQGNVLFCVFW